MPQKKTTKKATKKAAVKAAPKQVQFALTTEQKQAIQSCLEKRRLLPLGLAPAQAFSL